MSSESIFHTTSIITILKLWKEKKEKLKYERKIKVEKRKVETVVPHEECLDEVPT